MATEDDIIKLHRKFVGNKRITRGRAIKLYCKELCCAGDTLSWKECSIKQCFLWSFRLGKEIPIKKSSVQKTPVLLTNSTKNTKLGVVNDNQPNN